MVSSIVTPSLLEGKKHHIDLRVSVNQLPPHIKAIAEGDDSSLKVFTCEDKPKSDDVCVLDRKSREARVKVTCKNHRIGER